MPLCERDEKLALELLARASSANLNRARGSLRKRHPGAVQVMPAVTDADYYQLQGSDAATMLQDDDDGYAEDRRYRAATDAAMAARRAKEAEARSVVEPSRCAEFPGEEAEAEDYSDMMIQLAPRIAQIDDRVIGDEVNESESDVIADAVDSGAALVAGGAGGAHADPVWNRHCTEVDGRGLPLE